MKIEFEGQTWELDTHAVTLKQGVAIHLAYGMTINDYIKGLGVLDSRAYHVAYWLMRQQAGEKIALADADCPMIAFMDAVTEAKPSTDAEQRRVDEARAAEQAQAAPEVPTSPPPGDQAWSGPGYPAAMTPQPPEQQYRPQHGPTGYSPSP